MIVKDRRWQKGVARLSGRVVSWTLVIWVLTALAGCRSVPVEQAAPLTERLGVPADQVAHIEAGRAIYTDSGKCARCHRPKPIQDHSAQEWTESILPRMARKAKLSTDEKQNLREYVLAVMGGASHSQ